MAKILSPNVSYSGITATVVFTKGVGQTDDKYLIDWFRLKGYTVEGDQSTNSDEDQVKIDELKAYAANHNIDLGNATSLNGIKKKIEAAEKAETDRLAAEQAAKAEADRIAAEQEADKNQENTAPGEKVPEE